MTEEELKRLLALLVRGIEQTDREIAGYVAKLRLLMQRAVLQELSQLPKDRTLSQRQVLRLLGGFESLVMTDAVKEHIDTIDDVFYSQIDIVSRLYKMANEEGLPQSYFPMLSVYERAQKENVDLLARSYINEVRQAVANAIIGARETNLSDFDIADVPASRIFNELELDLKTATSAYSRIVALDQARSGGKEFVLYFGPKDDRNRPFCAERVNNVYSIEEVYTWDNGQGLPAHIYCGGYNCRHVLIPVARA